MAPSPRACLCMFLCLAAAADSAKVTPMEKVIGLLKDLSAKVAEEGKKEAAQYDKFACFCKEQADEKLYNIEKSEAKIKDLSAEIKQLDADIADLNGKIGDLSKRITDLGNEIDSKTKKREAEHEVYQARAKDMNEAINAAAAAIEALKDSKGAMSGAKVTNLIQVIKKEPQVSGAAAFLSKLDDYGAPKFQYQSNDIIATIEDLLATFKKEKQELDFEEHDINSAFEKDRLGLQNEKKFAEKDRAEKEAIVEEKTETRNDKDSNRSQETDDMNADQTFLDDLTNKCEKTAQLFDQRSKTRADELTALSEATQSLQEGAVPNFSANKKLVGLQVKKAVKLTSSAASFVQISSVQHQRSDETLYQRVQNSLAESAERLGSKALMAVGERVTLAKDHFVKVRGLIQDLLKKLKNDAKEEAEQKGVCDSGMAKAIGKRDKANADLEAANAKITTLTAKAADLKEEMQSLTEQIAKLKKELNEATELRAGEKADNEKTIEMSEEGRDAVQDAFEILKKFYGFAQTGKYVPPKADREGNNVDDLAPEFASEEYKGAGEESKGIMGILEVILSDFKRTISQTDSDEKDSQGAFDDFEKETNTAVSRKNKRIDDAKGELSNTDADILDQQQAHKDAKDLLDDALKSLESLHAMCVEGEETWEERKAKREAEIEALKDALNIFEDWKA